MINSPLFQRLLFAQTFLVLLFLSACDKDSDAVNPIPNTLLDVSGLAWAQDDIFIAVHDAKNSAEKSGWPRITICRIPTSELNGVIREEVYLQFPGPGGQSSDIESICSVPGTSDFLLVESGQEGSQFSRIFQARYVNNTVTIESFVNWPVSVVNVEASEVHMVGNKMVFLYAERNQDSSSTYLKWAEFSLNPMTFGTFDSLLFHGVDPLGTGSRAMVALEVDSDGLIYTVSTYDSGVDIGPYRSVVWQIGRITDDGSGNPQVVLGPNVRIGSFDGLKVEAVTVRELTAGNKEIYIGTDDENYGGLIRLVP